MKLWVRRLMLCGLVPSAATLFALPTARADPVFGLGTWSGEVSLDNELDRQTTHTTGTPDTEFVRRRHDEKLGLRNSFYVFNPRLLTGNLGMTFGLIQEQDRTNGLSSSQTGKLIDYNFAAGILSYMPYPITIFANRSENLFSHPFGGQSALTFESRGASFRLNENNFLQNRGFRYFSAALSARQEHTQETTTVFTQQFHRDEKQDILGLQAHKGFTTADLDFNYETTHGMDSTQPELNNQNQSANLAYSLDFGPTLNRRWDSRLYYFTRSDKTTNKLLSADERVHIDHFDNLSTDYSYLFNRSDTQAGAATLQAGSFQLEHRLYRELSSSLKTQVQRQNLPNGNRTHYAEQLNSNYQRNLTPSHHIFVSAGGRYQIDNNNLTSPQINVTDAAYAAPSPLGAGASFTLSDPFVNTSTIVVVDTRGRGRLPTTLDVDYNIIQEGNLTKIVPLVTSPVIQAGDPLLVSYTFEVAPNIKFSTSSWWLNGGLDFSWIALSLMHQAVDEKLLSGRDNQFLENQRTDTAQLELRGDWGPAQARASAAYEIQDSTHLAYTRWRFSQLLTYRPYYDLMMALNADQSITDFTLPVRHNATQSVRLTLDWFAPDGWGTTTYIAARRFEDSEAPTETQLEAGVKARRHFGELDIVPSFTAYNLKRGSSESTDMRVELTITRRF